jgi:hypothetical protein
MIEISTLSGNAVSGVQFKTATGEAYEAIASTLYVTG